MGAVALKHAEEARRFVELEDWLNEGVPLAAPVMKEVLEGWYGRNDPAGNVWRVADTVIDPARITRMGEKSNLAVRVHQRGVRRK